MVDITLNDDEKLHQLKEWWKKYGNWVSTIIIVILLAILGWQYWQHHKTVTATQASMLYDQLMVSATNNDAVNTAAEANQLINNYSSTPYAKLAAMVLAQQAVNAGKLDAAAQQLQWVIDHSQQPMLSQLAQLRLARVLIAQNKPAQALQVLAGAEQIYPGATAAVRAQAYIALGQFDKARSELQQTIQGLPADSSLLPILQMQLNSL